MGLEFRSLGYNLELAAFWLFVLDVLQIPWTLFGWFAQRGQEGGRDRENMVFSLLPKEQMEPGT